MQDPNVQITKCIPEQILPNPYQTREREDPEHILKLAESIAAEGLLQIPVARTNAAGRIELAFGHSRLAGFKRVASVVYALDRALDLSEAPVLTQLRERALSGLISSEERQRWLYFPVILRDLNDEDMFRLAVSENLRRRDLSPIEEAHAMLRYRDEFAKTSEAIGELFGLSDSAVRNKMRLLQLPDSVQAELRKGSLTEGQARALIPLYNLPLAMRLEAEDTDDLKPSVILEVALSGSSPAQIAALVTKLTSHFQGRLTGPQQLPIDTILAPAVSTETAEESEPEPAPELPLPAPEPEPLPLLRPVEEPRPAGVSVETPRAPEPEPEGEEEPEEEPEIVPPPARPAPQPAPVMAPTARPAAPEPARPAPAPTPAPAPVAPVTPAAPPAKPLSWAESTITLTLTYWPEDGNPQGRQAMAGIRLNQGAPKMLMLRESQIELPQMLQYLMTQLKQDNGG